MFIFISFINTPIEDLENLKEENIKNPIFR